MILLETKEPIQNLEEFRNMLAHNLRSSEEGIEGESVFVELRRNTANQYYIDTPNFLFDSSYKLINELTKTIQQCFLPKYRTFYEVERIVYQVLLNLDGANILQQRYPELTNPEFTPEELFAITEKVGKDIERGALNRELHFQIMMHPDYFPFDHLLDSIKFSDKTYFNAFFGLSREFVEESILNTIESEYLLPRINSKKSSCESTTPKGEQT